MSLFSYLNVDSSDSLLINLKKAQSAATESKVTTSIAESTSRTANTSSVLITVAARRAAAEKDDAGKAASAFAGELRTTLDDAYATAGERHSADLTALSGRALAVIALNEDGQFSRAEIAAAKTELRGRDRQAVLTQISENGLTASSLAAYLQQATDARSTMSAEERNLRDANPSLR